MKIKFCPMCKSTDISVDAKLEMTYNFCRHCGFRSTGDFPEKIIKKIKKQN